MLFGSNGNSYTVCTESDTGKAILLQGRDKPRGFQETEVPRFHDNRHMKVVRLSALGTGRLYPPGNIPGTHFCWRLSQPQGHSAAGRIMSMKNSNDTIGNRTRDLPTCSAVPQPTAPPVYTCVCICIPLLHNIETLVGRKNKIGIAVNTACEGNISACHFGQACHRLVTPSTERLTRHPTPSLPRVQKSLPDGSAVCKTSEINGLRSCAD